MVSFSVTAPKNKETCGKQVKQLTKTPANQGAGKMKVKRGKQGTVSKIKPGSAMPTGRKLFEDSVNEIDIDHQNKKGKGKAEICTIQEFYHNRRFVMLAHTCCRYRDAAMMFEKTTFNEELVTVIIRLLGAKFCHFCLERSSGAVMGMLHEAFKILNNRNDAGGDNFELKQNEMTIAHLKEVNQQLQNAFVNLLQQKTDLECLADKLSCQVKDLEKKKSSCTDKLVSSVQKNTELRREYKKTKEFEALQNKVNELKEHFDLQNKKYQALTDSVSAKSEELRRTQLNLEHAAKANVHLQTKVKNVAKQRKFWLNKFNSTSAEYE